MRNRTYINTSIALLMVCLLVPGISQKYSAKNNLGFTISGTSTIHDWEMTANTGTCTLDIQAGTATEISGINSVTFTMPAKSLKSGKSAMDKNAYTALKADSYPNITAKLKTAQISAEANGVYTVKSTVVLTMAGVTKEIPMQVKAKRKGNTLELTGEKKISMSDFKIEPPVFMMGAVKTGNDVTIKFNMTLTELNTGTTAN